MESHTPCETETASSLRQTTALNLPAGVNNGTRWVGSKDLIPVQASAWSRGTGLNQAMAVELAMRLSVPMLRPRPLRRPCFTYPKRGAGRATPVACAQGRELDGPRAVEYNRSGPASAYSDLTGVGTLASSTGGVVWRLVWVLRRVFSGCQHARGLRLLFSGDRDTGSAPGCGDSPRRSRGSLRDGWADGYLMSQHVHRFETSGDEGEPVNVDLSELEGDLCSLEHFLNAFPIEDFSSLRGNAPGEPLGGAGSTSHEVAFDDGSACGVRGLGGCPQNGFGLLTKVIDDLIAVLSLPAEADEGFRES